MTQLAGPTPQEKPPRDSDAPVRTPQRARRIPIIIALIVALAFCGITQNLASTWKDDNSGLSNRVAERGALSGMDSYALALMLGGLRGPLVMVLWSKVENQKMDRDLEDVDTMIEWIRLLQPEFDTVHIFQIWNKAYNISVMMASTAAKYQTILDAIDYAHRVEQDKPGDLNIADSLARVYSEKLGGQNTAERVFYRKQFLEDSLTDANRRLVFPNDTSYRRFGFRLVDSKKNGPLLDEHGNIDAALLVPITRRPSDLPADSEWNDGSELQYLAQYQPFTYGLGPVPMGYNYAKIAQVALTVGGQRPLQVSDTVVDSRPAVILKQWCENENDHGVTAEMQAFGGKPATDVYGMTVTNGSRPMDAKIASPYDLQQAIDSFHLSARLGQDGIKEFRRHMANPKYVNPFQSYLSHIEELQAMTAMSSAEADFLTALTASPADRDGLLKKAADEYQNARADYERLTLRYATEAPIALKYYRGTGRNAALDTQNPQELNQLFLRAMADVRQLPQAQREFDDQRDDYTSMVQHADARLRLLGAYNAPSLLQIH